MARSTIRGILLDFYGTVVHEDDELIRAAAADIAAASPLRPAPAEVSSEWGSAFAAGCGAASGSSFRSQRSIERAALAAVVDRFDVADLVDVDLVAGRLFEHWQAPEAFPDALTFLDLVELPIVVVSNIDRPDLEAALAYCGLDNRFDGVVTSSDVRCYKPRPEPFAVGLDLLRARLVGSATVDPASEVLHIGDSRSSDVAGATNAGIAVAHVDRSRPVRPSRTGSSVASDSAVPVVSRLDHVLPLLASR